MNQKFLSIVGSCLALTSVAHAAEPAVESAEYKLAADGVGIVVKGSTADAMNGLQVLVDTDGNTSTGFSVDGSAKGFDLLIEGSTLYEHSGAATDWNWKRLGDVAKQVDGTTATIKLPKANLKSDTVRLYSRLLTADWQKVIATDKAGVVEVAMKAQSASPAGPALVEDEAGDAKDPATDFTLMRVSQVEANVQFSLRTNADSKFDSVLLLVDSDASGQTGYQPPADPAQGFDVLVQGEDVFKFRGGGERGSWAWDKVGTAKREVAGANLTVSVEAAMIGGTDVGVSAWFMSPDYQTPLDRIPNTGTFSAKIAQATATNAQGKTVEMSAPRPNRHLPIRERVAKATSYYCFYGTGKVAELSHYDVAILHSPQFKKPDIAKLNELGVVTVGYITCGEDDKLRQGDGKGPGGMASWYFDKDKDNVPDQNSIWKSWYANAADPLWRADRVKEAKRLVEEEGYQGIFLDTLDTFTAYPQSKDGMVQLVADLREALPGKTIVLNQGFDILEQVAPYADAMMLESFTLTYDFDSKTYMRNYPQSMDHHLRRVNSIIRPVIAKHPINVFVLEYARPDQLADLQDAADRSKTLGFLFAAAPIFLDEVYLDLPAGKTDSKWEKMQATPESMSHTLAEARNGFPAGTKFLPSSCFAGYQVEAIIDGKADRSGLHWSKAAWASSEDGEPAILEIQLPGTMAGGKLKINWHDAGGPSRAFTVETRTAGVWKNVQNLTENKDVNSVHALPSEPFDAVRITQPVGGGSVERPDLMWVGQIWLEN